MPTPPENILVMRYRFIGDTLLTVPFLRNLRQAYPNARIDMLVGPNSGEILQYCPYIDTLITFDTTRKHLYESTSPDKKTNSFWSYVHLLRENRYDTAFILKRSFSSAALAFMAGIPQRIGFDTENRRLLLTRAVPYRSGQHEIQCFLDLLRAEGIPVKNDYLESWWTQAEEDKIHALWISPAGATNILLHLTSSNRAKQWPSEKYIPLAAWLLRQEGVHLHTLGAALDHRLYENLRNALPENCRDRVHNWCGKLTLNESMALIHTMNLAVGVDSGTLHMAAAANVPVVALFGPMDEVKWRPYGKQHQVVTEPLPCQPCDLKTPCNYGYQCMQALSLEKVKWACQQSLRTPPTII